jgi:tetratricopeptide (TPR) repeat protein
MKKIFYTICTIAAVSVATLCYSQDRTYTDAERSALLARSDSLSAVSVDLYNAGKYDEAIRLCTEALNIRERVLGKEHPDYANSLDNLAGYNSDTGNYSEAIRLCTEALNICERILGKEQMFFVATLLQ